MPLSKRMQLTRRLSHSHTTKHPTAILAILAEDRQECLEIALIPTLASLLVPMSFSELYMTMCYTYAPYSLAPFARARANGLSNLLPPGSMWRCLVTPAFVPTGPTPSFRLSSLLSKWNWRSKIMTFTIDLASPGRITANNPASGTGSTELSPTGLRRTAIERRTIREDEVENLSLYIIGLSWRCLRIVCKFTANEMNHTVTFCSDYEAAIWEHFRLQSSLCRPQPTSPHRSSSAQNILGRSISWNDLQTQ